MLYYFTRKKATVILKGGINMITIKENTTLVGVSELRAGLEAILEKTRKGLVIIEKRHKPQAVLMSNEEYEHIQQVLEIAEDLVLGFMADERYKNSKSSDYINIEKLL
jgi:prevent-host-death family protein